MCHFKVFNFLVIFDPNLTTYINWSPTPINTMHETTGHPLKLTNQCPLTFPSLHSWPLRMPNLSPWALSWVKVSGRSWGSGDCERPKLIWAQRADLWSERKHSKHCGRTCGHFTACLQLVWNGNPETGKLSSPNLVAVAHSMMVLLNLFSLPLLSQDHPLS